MCFDMQIDMSASLDADMFVCTPAALRLEKTVAGGRGSCSLDHDCARLVDTKRSHFT